jgi:hypothetical protein
MTDEASIDELKKAIRQVHGCDATWVKSIPVREERNGRVIWEGQVQLFALWGHARARECFAWSHAAEVTPKRFHAVLRLPPVDDAVTAVRTALSGEVRRSSK